MFAPCRAGQTGPDCPLCSTWRMAAQQQLCSTRRCSEERVGWKKIKNKPQVRSDRQDTVSLGTRTSRGVGNHVRSRIRLGVLDLYGRTRRYMQGTPTSSRQKYQPAWSKAEDAPPMPALQGMPAPRPSIDKIKHSVDLEIQCTHVWIRQCHCHFNAFGGSAHIRRGT